MRQMENQALSYPAGGKILQNHAGFGDFTGFVLGWGQLAVLLILDLEAALNEIEVHAYLLFIYFWGRVGGKNTGVSCH